MTSPWDILADMPEIDLVWTADDDLLEGAEAWYDPDVKTIYMDSRLKRLVARCALAHELAHIVRGDERCDNAFYDQRRETAADRLAARWLLPDLDELALEIATTESMGHAASSLRVTLDIFEARIDGLHPSERHAVRARVRALHGGTC